MLPISGEKGTDGMIAPGLKGAIDLAVLVGSRSERPLPCRRDRVVERPNETGYIARCGRFGPALLDAAPRLTFEVDDYHVVFHHQHLAEMEIAVMTDFHGIEILRQ